jgi:hypothetical protein
MASEGQHPDDVRALERELRALVPKSPNIDAARLMYLAGQASLSPMPPPIPFAPTPVWRAQWLWPISTAAAGVVAAWLAVLLAISYHHASLEPKTRVIVRPHPPVVPVPQTESKPATVEATAVATIKAEDAHYLRDRQTAIRQGVEALPSNSASGSRKDMTSYKSLYGGMLGRDLGFGTRPSRGW